MDLTEREVKEIRQLRKKLNDGEIKIEVFYANLAAFNQTIKRQQVMLQKLALLAKYGKKMNDMVATTNILHENSFVDLGEDVSDDKIHCQDNGLLVTRNDCLEFSGCAENFQRCSECHNFTVTRRLLLGNDIIKNSHEK